MLTQEEWEPTQVRAGPSSEASIRGVECMSKHVDSETAGNFVGKLQLTLSVARRQRQLPRVRFIGVKNRVLAGNVRSVRLTSCYMVFLPL